MDAPEIRALVEEIERVSKAIDDLPTRPESGEAAPAKKPRLRARPQTTSDWSRTRISP
jgi:hypothetical protein